MAKPVEEKGRKCIGSAATLKSYKMAGSPLAGWRFLTKIRGFWFPPSPMSTWGTASLQLCWCGEKEAQDHLTRKFTRNQWAWARAPVHSSEWWPWFFFAQERDIVSIVFQRKWVRHLEHTPVALAWFICVSGTAQERERPVNTAFLPAFPAELHASPIRLQTVPGLVKMEPFSLHDVLSFKSGWFWHVLWSCIEFGLCSSSPNLRGWSSPFL